MITFPYKRVYGLIGAPRCGKNAVADFLTETRGFEQIAFADSIKEEFGISKEDFEAAKISGNIQQLRDELWAFSAEKKKGDPFYFINKVISEATESSESVIITDIRTKQEFQAVMDSFANRFVRRIYWVHRSKTKVEEKIDGFLAESRLELKYISRFDDCKNIKHIYNSADGLLGLFKHLEWFFLKEDICDIYLADHLFSNISSSRKYNNIIEEYLEHIRKEE